MFLRCDSELVQDRWDWSTPTGALPEGLLGAAHLYVCPVVSPFTNVRAPRGFCRCRHCSQPCRNLGRPVVGPGVSQALFSPGHQHRFTEGGSQHCSSHAPGPAVVAMEAAQPPARPSPHKAHSSKAGPISALRALIVLLGCSVGAEFTESAAWM